MRECDGFALVVGSVGTHDEGFSTLFLGDCFCRGMRLCLGRFSERLWVTKP